MKPTIGIIGFGFLGRAMTHGFYLHANVKIYDKYDNSYDSLGDTVNSTPYIFVGVPTPMNDDGSQDLSSMDDAVESIVRVAKERKIIVLRSTAIPGTTRRYAEKYDDHDFVFMPEFLTERQAKLDFINSARFIFGGDRGVTEILEELFRVRFVHTPIYHTTWEGAEAVKYMCNCFFAVKVSFLNEIYDVCEKINVPYDDMKKMFLSDQRIGNSHADVPGHDGHRGYGGKCLVAGTKLITNTHEFVNIEDVSPGMLVFDGTSYTRVTGLSSRLVDRTIKIVSNGRMLEGSEDHIHMITKDFVDVEEKKLCEITDDSWLYVPSEKNTLGSVEIAMGKRPNGYVKVWHEYVGLDEPICRVIGLYLAEGCSNIYNKKEEVYFSFGKHEEHLANEVCNTLSKYGLNPYKRLQATDGTFGRSVCWIVRVRSMWLYRLFERLNLGHNAHDKNIKYTALSEHLTRNIIGGWLDGDGSYCDGTIECHSESTDLIMKMDSILLANGINPNISRNGKSIRISTRAAVERVCSWTNRLNFDVCRYKTDTFYDSPNCKIMPTGWATKVKSVEIINTPKTVFAIETESGKYVANNILTHNCFPKDVKAFYHWGDDNGVDLDMCKAADKVNNRVREVQDWLGIKGATSKNDYKSK